MAVCLETGIRNKLKLKSDNMPKLFAVDPSIAYGLGLLREANFDAAWSKATTMKMMFIKMYMNFVDVRGGFLKCFLSALHLPQHCVGDMIDVERSQQRIPPLALVQKATVVAQRSSRNLRVTT